MTENSKTCGGTPRDPDGRWFSLILLGTRLVLAMLALLLGAVLVYAFGAGYFGSFAVPTPLNFVVAPALLISLVLVLWKFLKHQFAR
jgi:hypothetical protein